MFPKATTGCGAAGRSFVPPRDQVILQLFATTKEADRADVINLYHGMQAEAAARLRRECLQSMLSTMKTTLQETLAFNEQVERHNEALHAMVIARQLTDRNTPPRMPTETSLGRNALSQPEPVERPMPFTLALTPSPWPDSALSDIEGIVSAQCPTPQVSSNAGARGDPSGEGGVAWPIGATTVFIQNISPKCTREDVIRVFKPDGSYNLIYHPYNIKQRRSCQYCFINFVAPELARQFQERWHDQEPLLERSAHRGRRLIVKPASVQGLEANLVTMMAHHTESITNDRHLPLLFVAGEEAQRLAEALPHAVCAAEWPDAPLTLDVRTVLAELLPVQDQAI